MRARKLRQIERFAVELEEELSRARTLLRHLSLYEIRPEIIFDYDQRTEELENMIKTLESPSSQFE